MHGAERAGGIPRDSRGCYAGEPKRESRRNTSNLADHMVSSLRSHIFPLDRPSTSAPPPPLTHGGLHTRPGPTTPLDLACSQGLMLIQMARYNPIQEIWPIDRVRQAHLPLWKRTIDGGLGSRTPEITAKLTTDTAPAEPGSEAQIIPERADRKVGKLNRLRYIIDSRGRRGAPTRPQSVLQTLLDTLNPATQHLTLEQHGFGRRQRRRWSQHGLADALDG